MALPNISQGQIAIDPAGGVFYYKDRNNNLINSSLHLLQESSQLIATTDSLEVDGNIVISGNLTVDGTTVTINTETLMIEDNIIVLNFNYSGNAETDPSAKNAGIEVERGSQPNVLIRWNESTNKWQFTNDGTNYTDLGAGGASASSSPPAPPTTGALWFNSDTGQTFIYYDSFWVEI